MPSTMSPLLHTAPHSSREEVSDGELLEAFAARQDEVAFRYLVERYGAMVHGVCLRVAGHRQDAEDAFQATFLVLARQGASLRLRKGLGAWLYGVAYRTASSVKRRSPRRREHALPEDVLGEQTGESPWAELLPLLDQAIRGLPGRYREVVIRCDLLGKTKRKTAEELGCPEGTISSRLARARDLLRRRLARHVPALSGAALISLLAEGARARPSPILTHTTLRSVSVLRCGGDFTGSASAEAFSIHERVVRIMGWKNLGTTWLCFLLVGLLVGTGLLLGAGDAISAQLRSGSPKSPEKEEKPSWKSAGTLEGHKAPVRAMTFGPGDLMITADEQGHVKSWDVARKKLLGSLKNHEGVRWLMYGPEARWVALGGETMFSLSFGKHLKENHLVTIGKGIGYGPGPNGDDKDWMIAFAIAGDGKRWALRQGGSLVRLSEMDLQRKGSAEGSVFLLRGHKGEVLTARFSDDDRLLATGGTDKAVRVWGGMGEELAVLEGHDGSVLALAFNPAGTLLASASEDGTIRLWDVRKGEHLRTLNGHRGAVHDLAFDIGGETLASAGGDGAVILWSVKDGKKRDELKGHKGPVRVVRFSREGKVLASAGKDGVIRLWRMRQ